MTKFFLIRHATNDSVGKRLAGRTDGISLNTEGWEQARSLAQQLQPVQFSAIYSSPLERAIRTAQPIAALRKMDVISSDDFLEIDFGEWTNVTFSELELKPAFKLFNAFRSNVRIPGGEMMAEAQLRIVRGMQKAAIKHKRSNVAIVSHADMIRAAVAWYAGIPLDMLNRFEISPASVSVIEIYPETSRLMLLNHTGRIDG